MADAAKTLMSQGLVGKLLGMDDDTEESTVKPVEPTAPKPVRRKPVPKSNMLT